MDMSRHGYSDDCYGDEISRLRAMAWEGATWRALRGKRGQVFLRECLAALEAFDHSMSVNKDRS